MGRHAHDVSYYDLPALLPERIPEIRERYQSQVQEWDPEVNTPHNAYGDILNLYLIELLRSNGDRDETARAFVLIEEMATHPDANVRNVVEVTIVERLVGEGLLGPSWTHMGEATQKFAWDDVTSHPEIVDPAKFDEAKYLEAWKQEVEGLGGIENLTIEGLLSLRTKIYPQFGIKVYPRA